MRLRDTPTSVRVLVISFGILFSGLSQPVRTAAQVPGQEPGANGASTPAGQVGAGRGGRGGGGTPAYPTRPPADPTVLAHGKQIFSANCAFCHGAEATGGETGPNLIVSQLVLDDQHGELIAQVVQNGRVDKGMPKFDLSAAGYF